MTASLSARPQIRPRLRDPCIRDSILALFKDILNLPSPAPAQAAAQALAIAAEPLHHPIDLYPPLTHAITRQSTTWISALAGAGALLDRAPITQFTPLGLALDSGLLISFQALLDAGAPPDSLTGEPNEPVFAFPTCLERAISTGRAPFAAALIEAGCDIHSPLSQGKTPLAHAIIHDQPSVAASLLLHGADPLAEHDGDTPLGLARRYRRPECAEIIASFLEARALSDALPPAAVSKAPVL